jgi:hypothetical protein
MSSGILIDVSSTESQVAFHPFFLLCFCTFPMTFLNPLALFGLAAAAIPILIHLLNLRRLKTIDFSTLRFLRELQKTTMRRLRLRQWILLILRTLLVLFLVLAFARPALKGAFPDIAGGRATSTMVLILDDSPSMTLRNTRGVLFDQAKTLSETTIRSAQASDRIYFLRLSEIQKHRSSPTASSPTTLLSAVRTLSSSLQAATYREALDIAEKLLAENRTANREVYILGDAQATQFGLEKAGKDSVRHPDPDARLFFVELPPLSRDNLAVASIELKNQILAPGKPLTLQVLLHNHGEAAIRNSIVSLYLDGARVAQRSLDLAAQATSTLTFQATPQRRGMVPGYIQLEDDAFIADNQFFFVVPVPERPAVVLAGQSADDTRYPAIALALATDTTRAVQYDVTRATGDRLSSVDFRTVDVLVLAGIRALTSGIAERLTQFVQSGGGLLFFPGPATDLQSYNAQLFSRMGIPGIRVRDQQNPPGVVDDADAAGFLTFSKVDLAHPLFSGMFDNRTDTRNSPPELESPRVHNALTLAPTTRSNTLIQMSDGRPFLIEYPVGEGRVLMCAVEAGTSWSDFPLKGLFAPLVHRSVAYLASGRQASSKSVVGQPLHITARTSEGSSRTPHILQSPSGAEERIVPTAYSTTGTATFETSPTEEVGVYTLNASSGNSAARGQKQLQAVAVNLAPEESDLRALSDEEWQGFWKSSGFAAGNVKRLQGDVSLESAIHESRYGVELWSLFIVLALACAAAEMLLGRENKEHAALEEDHV